jgi:hypothetical protein
VWLEGGVFEALEPFFNLVLPDFVPGHLAVAFIPDMFRPPSVPAGNDILVGKLHGFVSDAVQPGDEIRIEPVAFAEGDEPRPDRLRSEVVVVEEGKPVVHIPALEAAVLRVVDASETTFFRGDANFDLTVNISDPIFTLGYLFLGGGAPPCEDAADADDNGKLELTDAVLTLNYLFNPAGKTLAPPHPERGRDARPDDLLPCREPAP